MPLEATPEIDAKAVANELSALKARLKQIEEDPDEALAAAGYDFDKYTSDVVAGKRRPKSAEERRRAAEASEIETLRRERDDLKGERDKAAGKAAYDAEIKSLLEELIEDEFPIIRGLNLEHTVMGKKLEKLAKGETVDLKALAKEIEDHILGDVNKVVKNPKSRARILADKELVEELKADLGLTTAQAKRVIAKVGSVTSKASESKAKDEPTEAKKSNNTDSIKDSTVSKWLAKKAKVYKDGSED